MARISKTATIQPGCVACGSCVRVCPRRALSVFQGIYAVVQDDLCVGCGKCVKACPAGVIELEAKEGKQHESEVV